MSEQPIGTRRALQIARRYKALIGSMAIVGAVCGIGYAAKTHATYTAQALVVLEVPPSAQTNNAYMSLGYRHAVCSPDQRSCSVGCAVQPA